MLALLAVVLAVFADPVIGLFRVWWDSEEYGHGLFMPFIAAYIIWYRRSELATPALQSNAWGGFILLVSILLLLASTLADLESAKQYALCLALVGVALTVGGMRLLKVAAVPILLIALVVPLPYLVITKLTSGLQLISSEFGTWIIRLFGIPVYLEGNIIDMGQFKLQVVEACSGLRYLYPLLSIGLLVAYFLRAPMWFRAFVVVATIPITIVMNAVRIGITGVLVNQFGNEVAEGFLHDFEGWIVFVAALSVLLAVVWVYKAVAQRSQNYADLFEMGASKPATNSVTAQISVMLFVGVLGLSSLGGAGVLYLKMTDSIYIPERSEFVQFPMRIDGKNVDLDQLTPETLAVLRPDDYFLGNYGRSPDERVSLYMVYYQQQHNGSALHSPSVCIPGGGWIVKSDDVHQFTLDGEPAPWEVKRVVIEKGEYTQLVYYWIDQMGQRFTNEYVARASLLKNAVTQQRSDGALVRVNVQVHNGDFNKADSELQSFIRGMRVHLPQYLPI